MYYKEDWEQAKSRFEALWNMEVTDRCCIAVTAPRRGCERFFEEYKRGIAEKKAIPSGMLTSRYMDDPARVVREKTVLMEHTFYGGEAFPQIWMNYGPVGHAAYFDAPYHVGETTTWFEPVLDDMTENSLRFNEENQILKWQTEAARIFAREGAGKFIVSSPDNSGSMDALAALNETENLLVNMLTEPDAVKTELRKVIEAWKYAGDRLYGITKDCNEDGASIGWLSIWAPGKFSQLQSDMSVMLSNPMFQDFIMPELIECAQYQDYSLYHMDGQEQLRHLDDILSIPKIGMIQWVSVAGQPSYMEFIPVFRKIQAAGKGILINDVLPGDVGKLLDCLRPEGLLIMTSADTQDEAESLLKMAERHHSGKH